MPGHDLADAARRDERRALPGTRARNFMALSRRVSAPGPRLYMAAVLNPDVLANEYQMVLGDASRAAALVGRVGELLSATEAIQSPPGRRAVAPVPRGVLAAP